MKEQNIHDTLHLSLMNADDCNATNWNFKKVISPFTRIYLVKRGDGSIVHHQKRYKLRPGHLYLIPSFTLCNYESKTFLDHYYIHLVSNIAGGANVYDFLPIENEIEACDADFRMMKRILELNPNRQLQHLDPCKYSQAELLPAKEKFHSSCQIASYIETQGILMQLFSRFIKITADKSQTIPYLPNQTIRLAVEYIHKNQSGPIKIRELAQACNLSNDYFSRLFLKVMGTRPVDYINRKRIESAQLMLITTNDPIESIAQEAGIDNFPYFNRLFKRYSCATPGEYRRLHRLV